MTVTRPALRYMGGKWRAAPWILEHFPPHRVYVEPYGGTASVLLQKPRAKFEVYNDLDDEVTNFFEVLRDRGADLERAIYLTPYSRAEFKLSHTRARDAMERARRFVVRSFLGIGALRSLPRADGSLVSSGFEKSTRPNRNNPESESWMKLPEAMAAMTDRLRGVIIENLPAIEVIAEHDHPDSLLYVDPPYTAHSRSDPRRSRYRLEMTDAQHEELAERLNRCQGMVVVSGYRCHLYDRLYAGWERRDFNAMAFGQRPRTESIWLRNICPDLFSQ